MNTYTLEDFIDIYHNNQKHIVLYGAGIKGRQMFKVFQSLNIKVECFCDAAKEKHSLKICNKSVLSIDQLENTYKKYYLIVSVNYASLKAVSHSLQEKDLNGEILYINTGYIYNPKTSRFTVYDHHDFLISNPWYLKYCYANIENFSSKYISKVLGDFAGNVFLNGILEPQNCSGEYIHVTDGERRTIPPNTKQSKQHLYLFGNCVIFGYANEDQWTVSSQLQKIVNEKKNSMQIHNKGVAGFTNISLIVEKIFVQHYNSGDIVVLGMPGTDALFNDLDGSKEQLAKLYFYYIKKVYTFCMERKLTFLFLINLDIKRKYELSIRSGSNSNIPAIEQHIREGYDWDNQFVAGHYDIELLISLLSANGIAYLDLNNPLNYPDIYDNLFIDCVHLSPAGNKFVAEKIYNSILNPNKIESQSVMDLKL